MIGLCHNCYTTNVEIQLIEGYNMCEKCMEDTTSKETTI